MDVQRRAGPLDAGALKEWVCRGVAALDAGTHSEMSWNNHWDGIDRTWEMPWYEAWARRGQGVPGDEAKRPGYELRDAVAVFRATLGLLPSRWAGVVEVVIPLESAGNLVTVAPGLVSATPDWNTPPMIYLIKASDAWRWYTADPGEEYRRSYLEDPWGLRQEGACVLFSCSTGAWSRGEAEKWFGCAIVIRAAVPSETRRTASCQQAN